MFGVVYLILNLINGKRYVGQTTQPLKVRMAQHMCGNCVVDRAIQKYGIENFYCGVIKTCASKEELDYWEKYFIAALHTKKPYGYNLTDGGEGTVGYHPTPEMRAKQSAIHKGKPHSPEWCAKIAAALAGKPKSPEHRAKVSATRRGKSLSLEHIAKVSAALKGKPHSPEHTARVSAALKGKPHSPERILKTAVACRKGSPFKNLLREIDERQLTYTALGKILGLCQTAVTRKMRGNRKFTERDKAKLEEFFGKSADYLLECNF